MRNDDLYRFAVYIPDGDSITGALVWATDQEEAMRRGFAAVGEEGARKLLKKVEGEEEIDEEDRRAFFSCERVADAIREHPDFYRFSAGFAAELLFTEEYFVEMHPDWTEEQRKAAAEPLARQFEESIIVCAGACGKQIEEGLEDMEPCAYPRDTEEGDEDFVDYYCQWCIPDEEDDEEEDE